MPSYYVYVIYESPAEEPYFCKVGYSRNPLRRLKELQAGNPRALRTPDHPRYPTAPFGFKFKSEDDAKLVESKVHERLRDMGLGLMSDYQYEKNYSYRREWFSGIHPEEIWDILLKESYKQFKKDEPK
tara:strand:- start:465 stop:848 length:384 start_codon:yes stop_codon:yes gene_type:complete